MLQDSSVVSIHRQITEVTKRLGRQSRIMTTRCLNSVGITRTGRQLFIDHSREATGLSQEKANLPDFSRAERITKSRHAGKANAAGDRPIVFRCRTLSRSLIVEELRRGWIHSRADGRDRTRRAAVADGTLLQINPGPGQQVIWSAAWGSRSRYFPEHARM